MVINWWIALSILTPTVIVLAFGYSMLKYHALSTTERRELRDALWDPNEDD